jgi:hypothetical protein
MALQAQIDGNEIVLEAARQRQEPIVFAGAEGEVDTFAFGRILLLVIETKLALIFPARRESARRCRSAGSR